MNGQTLVDLVVAGVVVLVFGPPVAVAGAWAIARVAAWWTPTPKALRGGRR